jgi:hypothetical protein
MSINPAGPTADREFEMRITAPRVVVGIAMGLLATACSGSSGTSQGTNPVTGGVSATVSSSSSAAPAPTSTTAGAAPVTDAPTTDASTSLPGAVDPNAPEIVEPGDIPDNQVFIVFASADGRYSVKVPEGWARTEAGSAVTFTDKYNSITLQSAAATVAPTVESVQALGLVDVSGAPTFALTDVKPVTRKAGTGVLASYEIGSAPNPVTGKKALLAVERYVFFHNGTVVTITLSGAKGADNVDPWKIVSDSLAWK